MTILLTVSPKEAVGLLNGTLATLIRSWKVPLGTAYIAVRKAKDRLADVLHNGDMGLDGEPMELSKPFFLKLPDEKTVVHDKKWNEVNGKIIAKCEIKKVDVVEMCQISVDSEAVNVHDANYILKGNVSDLSHFESVYDAKILERIGMSFDDFRELGRSTIDKGISLYVFSVVPLSVLDTSMTVNQFYTRKSRLIKATGTDLKHSKKIEYTRTSLTRLPSRWQYVEVGE